MGQQLFCVPWTVDLTKAFDKMNHYGLYIKLMDRNIPKCFLDVLLTWYSKCFAYVRWGTTISKTFQLLCGVRQGGVLSPCLFALFIDSVIQKLRASGYGILGLVNFTLGAFCMLMISCLCHTQSMLCN